MIYEKKIKTRKDRNGIAIRIPKAMSDIMNLHEKQELTIRLQDDCKSLIITVKEK